MILERSAAAREASSYDRVGLGIAVQIAVAKPEVSAVTVTEVSKEVIELIAPHIADHRLTVTHGIIRGRQQVGGRATSGMAGGWRFYRSSNIGLGRVHTSARRVEIARDITGGYS
jgi:hypothetical protein